MKRIIKTSLFMLTMMTSLLLVTSCTVNPPSGNTPNNGNEDTDVIDMDSKIINVYLIGGQSNAVGYGKDEGNAIANSDSRFVNGFDNVLYYGAQERYSGIDTTEGFKPVKIGYGNNADPCGAEIGTASAIADDGEMNAIIKCAWGATHLYPDTVYDISYQQGTWTSPTYIEKYNLDLNEYPHIGGMFRWWEETVTEGIRLLKEEGYTPVIKGMWWMQGEAEMFSTEMSSAYEELLRTLITDVRGTVGNITGYDCSDMPFVFGLPHWNPSYPNAPTYQDTVRNAMTRVANDSSFTNAAYVDCKDLAQHDMWHFKANGQKYLGENFIARLKDLDEGYTSDFAEKVSIDNDVKLLATEKGLEFTANLSSHKNDNEYKYGFLFVPTDDLTSNNITNDYINELTDKNISFQDVECQVTGEELDEYYNITFTGRIENIVYANMNTYYTAIAYIKDAEDNYLYSSNHLSTSLTSLASKELYTSSEDLEEIKKIVDAGVNKLFNVSEKDMYNDSSLKLLVDKELNLVNTQSDTTTNIGLTLQPSVTYYVKYTSANPSIVSVDDFGNLTTHKAGNTTITIECGGKTKTVSVVVTNKTIDGVVYDGNISTSEYKGNTISKTNGNTTAEINGMVVNKNIHLSLKITHNEWSEASRIWWNNDNIEFYIDGLQYIVKFVDGVAVFPKEVSHAVVNTVTSGGKLVTTVEMFIEGSNDQYMLKLGMNGKQFGWLGALWETKDQPTITTDGLIYPKTELPSTLTMDGQFNESIWSSVNTTNVINATANGASITVKGTVMSDGVLFGVTVNHTKAPETSLNGETNFWNYMNIEFHFNSDGNNAFLYTCLNKTNVTSFFGHCKTVKNGSKYTSTFEIYIPFTSIGVASGTTSVDFTCSGWFETAFYWFFQDNQNWNATHRVTANGITKK